ncbi:glucose PTS transporter subunit IIA [Novosphingobium sp. KA1]|uniref:glucose PTS transporter subunit IIA n=1 Tax=Novosphingobium sp. (strain KA1) TaxID=164608 RepID=UPI001A8FA149|nr:glucose PTS transporter subunit IIA [Novosphingobium sp. KA1]QSR17515.1 hypothetical protein CA833_10015 [Novosphingobium sp. KA1]
MTLTIASPLSGWATPLCEVPDPVFAQGMMGPGIAVDPADGRLVSPGAGRVVSVHPAGHAVTLELDAGPVLLMHVGLDTVGLGGAGFAPEVMEGERVEAGQVLILFDLDRLARTARSLLTPVIVTNGEAFAVVGGQTDREIAAGAALMTLEPCGMAAAAGAKEAAPLTSRSLLLPLAHGLHARPAARLASLAGTFPGILEIVAADGRVASARSAVAMLALGLGHGETLTLRGSDITAIDALAELIESGMGEHRPVVVGEPAVRGGPSALAPPLPLGEGEALAAVTAVPGAAIGPAVWLLDPLASLPETAGTREAETAALDGAIAQIRASLESAAEGDGQAAQIAAAHLVLLDDPELLAAARGGIAAGQPAGRAWIAGVEGFIAQLRLSPDPRLRERVDDLADLARRVALASGGIDETPPPLPPGAILLADDLYPSQLMALADGGLGGVVTVEGGATSHVAIIAAGLGLPMLVAAGERLKSIPQGAALLLEKGALTHAPAAGVLAAARARIEGAQSRRRAAAAHAHEPAMTRDGVRIEVFANLASAADAGAAVAAGAEGCGLLRSEFLFLDRAEAPSLAEQREVYSAISAALEGRPLIVRTLDIGADKPAPYLPMGGEENPALGLRGIRLQLAAPDLLDVQLRALVTMEAQGSVQIMLPMVSEIAELRAARAALERIAAEEERPCPPLGIMVETPAAALHAGVLAAEADFFSVGSNDLAQYTLARDRTNPHVAAGLDALHPAILQLIEIAQIGASRHGRLVGLCGGLGADPEAIPLLIGLGVRELSVSAGSVAETKACVRSLTLEQCGLMAEAALALPDAAAVRALVRAELGKIVEEVA